jgi:DNA topoisomerase-1
VVEALARTERGENQTRRKRQVKKAIQIAADDLANTATICRKSYVHEAVIEAFEQGRLPVKAKRATPARRILADVVSAHEAR